MRQYGLNRFLNFLNGNSEPQIPLILTGLKIRYDFTNSDACGSGLTAKNAPSIEKKKAEKLQLVIMISINTHKLFIIFLLLLFIRVLN